MILTAVIQTPPYLLRRTKRVDSTVSHHVKSTRKLWTGMFLMKSRLRRRPWLQNRYISHRNSVYFQARKCCTRVYNLFRLLKQGVWHLKFVSAHHKEMCISNYSKIKCQKLLRILWCTLEMAIIMDTFFIE